MEDVSANIDSINTLNQSDNAIKSVNDFLKDLNAKSIVQTDKKKHKFFRGIRCYASAFKKSSPDGQRSEALFETINLMNKNNNVVLLSLGKSLHSSLLILTKEDKYRYISVYKNHSFHEEFDSPSTLLTYIKEDKKNLNTSIGTRFFSIKMAEDIEKKDHEIIFIPNLKTDNMLDYIDKNIAAYKFSLLSKNCSRFTANVLISGLDDDKASFKNNRTWQMPANTLELAKEINALNKSEC